MHLQYRKEDGVYILEEVDEHRGNKVRHEISRNREIAVAYDHRDSVLHKHGNVESVTRWYHDAVKEIREAGYPEDALDLRLVTSDRWPVDALNRIIQISGIVTKVVEEVCAEAEADDLFPSID